MVISRLATVSTSKDYCRVWDELKPKNVTVESEPY